MKTILKLLIVFTILYIPYYFFTRINFEFDQAIHYSITDKQIDEIINKDSLNNFDAIFMGDYPTGIDNHKFITELEKNGYKKSKIDNEKLFSLKSILRFNINPKLYGTVSACAPSYRDIIILKKDNEISGIAKICFECEQYYFIGNSFYYSNFDEYEDLKKLLYSK
jgi:hypothetical protein